MDGQASNCQNLSYSLALRNVFFFGDAETIVLNIICAFSLLFCVIDFALIFSFKVLREPPSDILFFICMFGLLKVTALLTTIIYNAVQPIGGEIPPSFDIFCQTTGIIDIVAEASKLIYMFTFCIFYISKIKNSLKTDQKQLHFFCVILILLVALVMYFTDSIGVSLYGYCSFKYSQDSLYISVISSFVFVVGLVILSCIFMKYIKRSINDDFEVRKYFRFYIKFLVIICFNQSIIAFAHLMIVVSCLKSLSDSVFNTFQIIAKVAACLSPIFVFIVLINHPQSKKIAISRLLRAIYKKLKECKPKKKRQSDIYDDLLTTKRNSILIQLNELNRYNDDGYFKQVKDKARCCLLMNILACICIQNKQRQEDVLSDYSDDFSWKYQSKIEFNLTKLLQIHYQDLFIATFPALALNYVSYCPQIFTSFMKMDRVEGLVNSLLPKLNQIAIIKDSEGSTDGGRSGQYFFFSSNRKYILKTISKEQRNIYLSNIRDFQNHYKNNKTSMIVKIYGIFTIKNMSNEEINLMLMGNLLNDIKKDLVEKTYDLKGSSHHRQVIKNFSEDDQDSRKKTLKDIDFRNIEQKVWIETSEAEQLVQSIEKDCNFFKANGLIDYSLIVIKVNIGKSQQLIDLRNIRNFKSTKQKGVIYLFGIIDYLETWNLRKKGEKWYKSLFTKSQEISSQEPSFYAQRFMENLIKPTFLQ